MKKKASELRLGETVSAWVADWKTQGVVIDVETIVDRITITILNDSKRDRVNVCNDFEFDVIKKSDMPEIDSLYYDENGVYVVYYNWDDCENSYNGLKSAAKIFVYDSDHETAEKAVESLKKIYTEKIIKDWKAQHSDYYER